MATLDKNLEATAKAQLQKEASDIAAFGSAVPKTAVGDITIKREGPSVGSGFGTDTKGQIFRYNPDGALNTGTASPTTPKPTSGISVKDVLSKDAYFAQNAPEPVDERGIREKILAERQAQIDAVNGAFNEMVRRQDIVNEGNMGSTRAINARSGLMGSDFGAANESNQRQAGKAAVDAINRERGLQISAIYAKIDEDVFKRVEAEKSAAKGKADEYKSYLEKATGEAKDRAKLLGQQGLSIEDLRKDAPDQLKKLLDTTGYDEFELATVMNAAKPAAERVDYKTQVVGNKIIAYGVNPATKQMETIEKVLPPEAAGNEVKIVDGELWSVTPDGKSAVKIGGSKEPLVEQIGSGKSMRKVISYDDGKTWKDLTTGSPVAATVVRKTNTPAPVPKLTETKAFTAISEGIAGNNLAGSDGYVSPETYQALRKAWVDDGYNPTTFDTKMKGYRNPNNSNYVTEKQ